jgi:glycerol-3-phosphate O-acyltransferase/dihydroxyacetone phosphate acyltransferase
MRRVPLKYAAFRSVIRTILSLYFRNTESYGREFVPAAGRSVLIANHQAGLMDGLLILADLSQVIRLVIKNTLFENPIIGLFAKNLEMVPVFRKQDLKPGEVADVNRHKKMFDAVDRILTRGENILIFPEGRSHDQPHILELKSGAARVLLETEARHDWKLGLKWVPVSLDLEAKDRVGSRALLHYHPARGVEMYRSAFEKDAESAIQTLKTDMQSVLREITVNFNSWEDRVFLETLASLWLAQSPNSALLDRHNLFLKWKRVLEQRQIFTPEELHLLRTRTRFLMSTLTTLRLPIEKLFQDSTEKPLALLIRVLPRVLIKTPVALIGYFYWWLPTRLVKLVERLGAQGKRDVIATYHIVAGFVLYPLWLGIVALIVNRLGLTWNLSVASVLLGVVSGIGVLIWARRLKFDFGEIIRIYKFHSLQDYLARARIEALDVIRMSAALWNKALAAQIDIEEPAATEDSSS